MKTARDIQSHKVAYGRIRSLGKQLAVGLAISLIFFAALATLIRIQTVSESTHRTDLDPPERAEKALQAPLNPSEREEVAPSDLETGPSDKSISNHSVIVKKKAPLRLEKESIVEGAEPLEGFQNTPFYRTILENNLFAPLGSVLITDAPNDYQLLATLIPRDTTAAKKREAIIRKTAENTTHRFTLGEKLDAQTTLIDIQPKYITLERNGERRILRINLAHLWLK